MFMISISESAHVSEECWCCHAKIGGGWTKSGFAGENHCKFGQWGWFASL